MKLVDSKIILRLDFRPTLKYFERMFKVASTLEDEFEHWQASHDPIRGQLFDYETKRTVTVTNNSLILTVKGTENINKSLNEFNKLIALFLLDGQIEEVGRLGIRRMSLHETTQKYADYNDRFYEAFYSSREELSNIASDKISDTILVLEGVKDGHNTRLQIGPIKQEQVPQLFGVEPYENERDEKVIISEKNTTVAIDTDVYSVVKSNIEDTMKLVPEVFKLCDEMHTKVKDLVKEKTIT